MTVPERGAVVGQHAFFECRQVHRDVGSGQWHQPVIDPVITPTLSVWQPGVLYHNFHYFCCFVLVQ